MTERSLRELLSDKYRPKSLESLDFNQTANQFLSLLAKTDDMPHLIIEGCRGSGKRLRTELFLKAKYGDFKIHNMELQLEIPGKTELKAVHTLTSKYHYQINPTIHNIYDRSLLQAFIGEFIGYKVLVDTPFRIVIIEDADVLSTEAQESLRRTLETCIANCRFIFLSNKEDRLIAPLYSRCIRIQLASPTVDELKSILQDICARESQAVPESHIQAIAENSDRDLTRAIQFLDKCILMYQENGKYVDFDLRDYDNVYRYCAEIVENLISGTRLEETFEKGVRKQLYELVNYCVDCRSLVRILMNIALEKIPKSEHDARYQLCCIASDRDDSVRSSSKAVYHVESLCLHIFSIIKGVMEKRKKTTGPKKVIISKKTEA